MTVINNTGTRIGGDTIGRKKRSRESRDKGMETSPDKIPMDELTVVGGKMNLPPRGCGHFLGPFILQCPLPIMQLTVPNSDGIELDSFLRARASVFTGFPGNLSRGGNIAR